MLMHDSWNGIKISGIQFSDYKYLSFTVSDVCVIFVLLGFPFNKA